jgi:2-polyprenyl-3-methyl-5-hydroxy-6-metoxy-1,4-benzoquinol methylase
MVGRGKRVLDVGCWTGDLGRVLVSRGCEVSGLEVDEDAAEKAREVLEAVVVADLDVNPLGEQFPEGSFDVVIFADVLEHLRDPVDALKEAARLLAPEGRVVISVPNVTHGSVRLALLQGRWSYTETGLLDATHIRFFNRAGLLETFAEAGYVVEELRGTVADPLGVEVVVDAGRLPPSVVEWVRHQRDALVYQYVAVARPARADEQPGPVRMTLLPAVPEETVRVKDRYTAHSQAELEARQQELNVRDHIMGLEAAVSTAQARAAMAERRLKGATKRLERKNERISELAGQVARLQSGLGEPRSDPVRGALNKLRRGSD